MQSSRHAGQVSGWLVAARIRALRRSLALVEAAIDYLWACAEMELRAPRRGYAAGRRHHPLRRSRGPIRARSERYN